MPDIETLINQVQQEAQREEFPIDIPVYQSANLEPTYPILYAGNLQSPLCFFGRDLGRDEVHARQPLIGPAGKLVRQGFYQAIHQHPASGERELQTVCDRILLTNTVPYKPPENKAYSTKVKERFRPFVERLLGLHWQGHQIITLGTEAFKWFVPYGNKGEVNNFFLDKERRYLNQLAVNLRYIDDFSRENQKKIYLLPLPHPSPLNKTYYAKFPQMLQQRLTQIDF